MGVCVCVCVCKTKRINNEWSVPAMLGWLVKNSKRFSSIHTAYRILKLQLFLCGQMFVWKCAYVFLFIVQMCTRVFVCIYLSVCENIFKKIRLSRMVLVLAAALAVASDHITIMMTMITLRRNNAFLVYKIVVFIS